MVEARFKLDIRHSFNDGVNVILNGVKSKPFGEYTPSALIQMQINNPDAAEYFELGATYKVTFEKIEE